MNKLKSSLSAKIIAMILLCAAGITIMMSGAVVIDAHENGAYSKTYTEYYNDILERAAQREMIRRYSPYGELWYEYDSEFEDSEQYSNFRYNVYQLQPDGKEKLVYEGLDKGDKTICHTSMYYIEAKYNNGTTYHEGLYDKYSYGSVMRNLSENTDLKDIQGFRIDGYVLPITAKDQIYQRSITSTVVYNLRYAAMISAAISAVMFIALFCFLIAAAGHKKGVEGIYLNYVSKLPFDLVTVAAGGLGFAFILFGFGWGIASNRLEYVVIAYVVIATVATAAAVFIGMVYCMSFAVRMKNGGFMDGVWRKCLLYRFCMWIWGWVKKLWKGCVKYVKLFFQYLPSSIRPMAVVVVLMLIDVLVLAFNGYELDNQLVWLAISRILALGGILYLLTCFKKINQGMKKVAEDGESCTIDTKYLYGPLKEQAENLNNISVGINTAVAEKMKSERFRTELITNVSHDIKTPLTSIVNYVDLLEKEEPENEKMKEYLEVLSRQSARLKKLIDDLVEASKASSGSLPVNFQKLELGVLLQQTAGEYQEKMAEKGLELIISKPEENVEIMADGKHLWRVFDNLMNNIIKYAMPGTRVYLDLEKNDSNAVISFRNISDKRLNVKSEELLERFVRGDSSRNTEGSGLGLSIAQSLTTLQNGDMELSVDGDLFKVTLTFKTI